MNRLVQILLLAAILGCQLTCGSGNRKPETNSTISICELRTKPESFLNKSITVGGWVYSDIHHYLLEQGSCTVAVETRTDGDSDSKYPEALRFKQLVSAAQRGGWNTQGEVFTIIEGEFQTIEALTWGTQAMNWLGLLDAAFQAR